MAQSQPGASLDAWLAHLETLHPQKIDLELLRARTVAQRLGLLPAAMTTITVAGTNGKGSCVAALAALLKARGYLVGCYTSPHLLNFNERITIDQTPASDGEIITAFEAIEDSRQDISLSYFEFATLASLYLFKRAGVDFQVLEVGLGGRLDAVNIVDADACVITSIGVDHTEWLGDTRELIAIEKAGVARAGRPAVVAEQDPPGTLMHELSDIGARGVSLGRDWQLEHDRLLLPDGTERQLPDLPSLQASNLAAAVTVLSVLGEPMSQEIISRALVTLSIPGRQQQLMYGERNWLLDVAHNEEAVTVLARLLEVDGSGSPCHAVFGAMVDKPLRAMMARLAPAIASWHLPLHQGVARAAPPEDLKTMIEELDRGAEVYCHESPQAAFQAAQSGSEPGDRILVFGSFVTVGAQLECLQRAQSGRETLN